MNISEKVMKMLEILRGPLFKKQNSKAAYPQTATLYHSGT